MESEESKALQQKYIEEVYKSLPNIEKLMVEENYDDIERACALTDSLENWNETLPAEYLIELFQHQSMGALRFRILEILLNRNINTKALQQITEKTALADSSDLCRFIALILIAKIFPPEKVRL